MKKTNWIIGLNGLLFSSLGFAASPILSITPSSTSLTTRSDGETSVVYTVTNNSRITLTSLNINAYYESNAQAGSLTLQNDGCSGANLPATGSCTFGLIISGAQQPGDSINITPRVCANNNQACSTTTASNTLTVNIDIITNNAYAYFPATPPPVITTNNNTPTSPATSSLVPVNTNTLAIGTPLPNMHFTSANNTVGSPIAIGSVAVSLDGTMVYAAEQSTISSPGGYADIAVIRAGESPMLEKRITLPSYTTTGSTFFLAVSPNGQSLYVTATDKNDTNAVYAINLNTDEVTAMPSGSFSEPISVAISPDGMRAFVLNEGNENITVINTSNNAIIASITTGYTNPSEIIISPDGSTLYVLDQGNSQIGTINSENYTMNTIPLSNTPSGMALSSDGNTLYVSESSNTIEAVNTQTGAKTQITPTTNDSGLALTPDNTKLFASPSSPGNPSVITNLQSTPSENSISFSGVSAKAIQQFSAFCN